MMKPGKIRELLLGKALDPLKTETRHSMALVAFLAWVGLGADGLSSSAYGPEETFRALGQHTHLGLYMAIATALTVFIIALAYNQVIELFPTGGGGYRVASKLVGPYLGLISGCALILDYVLTVAISVAAGVEALASLLPLGFHEYKLWAEAFFIGILIVLKFWTRGSVTLLVVLYSISAFLTFAISLFGLCLYWWQHRKEPEPWLRRFLLSLLGFVICAGILVILVAEKFSEGGWATAVIIAAIAWLCIYIRNHYRETKSAIHSVDEVFANQPFGSHVGPVMPDPDKPNGGIHSRHVPRRRFACPVMGATHVSGALQELYLRQCPHRGFACLRW